MEEITTKRFETIKSTIARRGVLDFLLENYTEWEQQDSAKISNHTIEEIVFFFLNL